MIIWPSRCGTVFLYLLKQEHSEKQVLYSLDTYTIMRLLLLLLLLFPHALRAQIVLQGRVTDEESNILSFAQVILMKLPDSTVIKTELSDTAGVFKINAPVQQDYILKTTFPGYKDNFTSIPAESSGNLNIPVVMALKTHELNNLTVTASKPLLERKPDRIIFNVGSSVSSIGSDVYDLLKKAPGVRVNEVNGISIAGKSTVSVMIDNKLQQLGWDELAAVLRSMAAENVDRIEVITTPPARYDAQGNAGIINIVTKKSKSNGLNGSLGFSYQQRFRDSKRMNETLNYRNGRINIYNTGNTSSFDFFSIQKTTVSYGHQMQAQTMEQRNRPFYNRYQLGADYSINPASVIGVLYTFGTTGRKTSQLYDAPVISVAGGRLDSTLSTIADDREKALRQVVNLSYEWRIDTTGKKLNIDADYFSRNEDDVRDFHTQTFLPGGLPVNAPAYNHTTAVQDISISSVKADMILPYEFAELSFGAKASFIHTLSDNMFSYLQANEYVMDVTKSNRFGYTENTQAVYLSGAKKWGKWDAQIGLRLENTQTEGVSYTLAQTVTRNYLQLFPTAYLQYQLNDDNVFNINYSRRVGRPSYEELNPFRVYGSGTSYRTGNPFLQPSFYHTAELSYSFKSRYTFTAYTGIVNNIHAGISRVDTANNTFYFTYDNAGTSINTGVSAVMIFNPFEWWESTVQVQGYYDKVNSSYYNAKASVNGVTAFQAETNNSFIFNKDKTFIGETGFNYLSKFQYDFIVQGRYYVLTAGVKALFFDKQLTLGVNATDILRTELYTFRNIYNDVFQENYYDARSINISLNWKFGNRQVKVKRQRDTSTEEMRRYE